jgi:hypothetical protein
MAEHEPFGGIKHGHPWPRRPPHFDSPELRPADFPFPLPGRGSSVIVISTMEDPYMVSSLFPHRVGRRRFVATAVALCLSFALAGGPAARTSLAAKPGGGTKVKLPKTMLPLRITEVVVQNGQLVALGTLGANPVALPITLGTRPNLLDPTCPILDLMIGEIHLDLLGLNVDTSEICVAITAHEGGGLLGDLLCAVANLLSNGLDLGFILDQLTADELETLLDGITDLLNDVLGLATAPSAIAGVSDSTPGACDILNLSLGPIDLNLLGLQVEVDNCNNGPVTIDVTAVPGSLLGDLLAGLLCDLDDLLAAGGGGTALATLLNRIANVIADIAALA